MKNYKSILDENFSYGYDGEIYNLRTDSNSVFNCYYKRANYIPTSFKDECIKTSIRISDFARSQNKVPIILLSGGLDSEIVVRSFIDSGREFKTITNKFLNNLNLHEIEYIEKFCSAYDLKPNFVDLDIENWLISDQALNMAEISKCSRAEMLPTLKLLNDVYFDMKGIPVLGNGDFFLSKDINPYWRMGDSDQKHIWYYVEFEYILAWARYAVQKKIQGSINFFQQNPEIVLSMALDDEIQEIIKNNPKGRHTSRSRKYRVYKKWWPNIDLRQKYHGGEMILNLCDYVQKKYLNNHFFQYKGKWKLPVGDYIKLMMPIS